MNCPDYQEQILELLDGDLPPDWEAVLELHLGQCESCQQFYEVQEMLDAALMMEHVTLPRAPDFRINLKRRIKRESRRVWREYVPETLHIVGCLAMMAVGIWLLPLFRPLFSPLTDLMPQFVYISLLLTGATVFLGGLLQAWLEEAEY